jgi:hypothetical protein
MRPAFRLAVAAAAVLVRLALPPTVGATVTGGCTAEGHATSSSVDLTTATEWHIRSTDVAGGSGTSPVKMTAAQVYAYALGVEIPIASGTGDGDTGGAVDGVSVAPFAILGHRFTVAGSASGDGACGGSITIILDDVNPVTTVLGGGGIALFVVGGLGVLAGARSRGGAVRRVVAGMFGALGGAGLGLALEQFGVTDPTSPVGLALVLAGLLLGLLLTGLLGRRGVPVIPVGDTPAGAAPPGASTPTTASAGLTAPTSGTVGYEAMPTGDPPLAVRPPDGPIAAPLASPGQLTPEALAQLEDSTYLNFVRTPADNGFRRDPGDHSRAFNPNTGQNAAWDSQKGSWIDVKTGAALSPSVWAGASPR